MIRFTFCFKRGLLNDAFALTDLAKPWTVFLLMTRPHLLHAIVVSLHVHKIDVVILTPKTVGSVGV